MAQAPKGAADWEVSVLPRRSQPGWSRCRAYGVELARCRRCDGRGLVLRRDANAYGGRATDGHFVESFCSDASAPARTETLGSINLR